MQERPVPATSQLFAAFKRVRARDLLYLAILLAVSASAFYQPLLDSDTGWHVAVGRELWEKKSLPRMETFSYTVPGIRWEDTEWLYHAIIYPVWAAWGDLGLVLFTVALGILVVLQAYRLARLSGAKSEIAILLLPLVPILADRMRCRPDPLSILMLGILIEVLMRWRGAGEAPRLPKARESLSVAFILFFLFALWVNIHGVWVFGIGLFGLFVGGWILDQWVREGVRAPSLSGASTVSLAAAAGLLINPYGFALLVFPFRSIPDLFDPSRVHILEWGRTSLWTLKGAFILASAALLAALLFRRIRPPWAHSLPLALQVALGLLWTRYPAFACLPIITIAAMYLRFDARSSRIRLPMIAAGVFLSALTILAQVQLRSLRGFPTRWDLSQKFPVTETDFLVRNQIGGNVMHPFHVGGYLDWKYYPLGRVFADGRSYPFRAVVWEYDGAYARLETFHALLRRYPTDIVLQPYITGVTNSPERPGLPPRGYFHYFFPSEDWAPVFFGNFGGLFLKRQPERAGVIATFEYRAFLPDEVHHSVWSAERDCSQVQRLEAEINRFLEDAPASPFASEAKAALVNLKRDQVETVK